MNTMIAESPMTSTMGVGFDATPRRTGDSAAWRQAIGNNQIPARLALLPEAKPGWDRIGVSAIAQLSILVFFLLIPLIFPERLKTALNYSIVEIAQPITMVKVAPPPPKARA